MTLPLHGLSLIAGRTAAPSGNPFHAVDPATGSCLMPPFFGASLGDVTCASTLAAQSFHPFRSKAPSERASFLRRIAHEIEELGESLTHRFAAESGLTPARAHSERTRTCEQLRLFAELIEAGTWTEARIDTSEPGRTPKKPDLRSKLEPIGPVAVFGPANFPLAFSVAGGDTASALAAGCPVIVKAHSSHPGTSELVGAAINRAVAATAMPVGVFSLIFGDGRIVGSALVKQPAIRAVGFTGSRSAGTELFRLCNSRARPIPFFGELSSLNPVFLLPHALAERPEATAEGLHSSVTMGHGQFCTNPGLVLYIPGPGTERFVRRLTDLMYHTVAGPMLNVNSAQAYYAGAERVSVTPGVESLVAPRRAGSHEASTSTTALFRTDAATLMATPRLADEVFGPSTLLVTCKNLTEMHLVASNLEGQLTATIHAAQEDLADAGELAAIVKDLAGRIVFNGFPTGVEVSHAMVHSGPWPATTDARFTSVGTLSIRRWVRPVCWQNAPEVFLPPELLDANPFRVSRFVDGKPRSDPLHKM